MKPKLDCEDLVTYLSDYIDGNLNEDLTSLAQDHLATCENCRVVLDSTQQTILLYRERSRQEVITQSRKESLFKRISTAMRQLPDQNSDSM